jgi:hypothetical protein
MQYSRYKSVMIANMIELRCLTSAINAASGSFPVFFAERKNGFGMMSWNLGRDIRSRDREVASRGSQISGRIVLQNSTMSIRISFGTHRMESEMTMQ